jgi:hypothetical protein
MSHREFLDEDGRSWEVWDVRPSIVESSTTSEGAGETGGELADLERQVRHLLRLNLPTELRGGWLAFRSSEESRRLAPIPQRWVAMDDQDLALLVRAAKPIVRASPRS